MKKILLFVGVGLAVGGVVAVTALVGILPVPFGPLAEARQIAERSRPPVTVMYPTKERVVNLMDKQTTHYLKVQLTLEFIDSKVKDPPKGDAVKAQQDNFAKDMQGYSAVIEDALTTTLSSHSSADLLKPDGKDLLKQELIEKVNHSLHDDEKAVNVYYTSFIIQ
jgi:flagellar basal body-associated protein FliL